MKKDEKLAHIRRRAFELAASGRHLDYLTIENVLINEGFPEAREYLDQPGIRSDLKQACERAQKGRADA